MKKTLRNYQKDAIEAILRSINDGYSKNPLIALPTGTGKSLVIAGLVERLLTEKPLGKILILTHVKELLVQNELELKQHLPQIYTSFYCSGLNEKSTDGRVVFASCQSARKTLTGRFEAIIIDEAHKVSTRDSMTYKKIINNLNEYRFSEIPVIGLTATPYRVDDGIIYGKGKLFDKLVYDKTTPKAFKEFYESGALVPVRIINPYVQYDMSEADIVAGDYSNASIHEIFDKDNKEAKKKIEEVIDQILLQANDLKKWLIFAPTLLYAGNINYFLKKMGIESGIVTGTTPKDERDKTINAFQKGKIRALVNVSVLTTGFNVPDIDLIVMLRPTISASLWVQMLGRGTRPFEGKKECLVLDFVGNNADLGGIEDVKIWSGARGASKKNKKYDPTKRYCRTCEKPLDKADTTCNYCGAEYFEKSTFLIGRNSQDPPLEFLKDIKFSIAKEKEALSVKYTLTNNKYFVETIDLKSQRSKAWIRMWGIESLEEENALKIKENLENLQIPLGIFLRGKNDFFPTVVGLKWN